MPDKKKNPLVGTKIKAVPKPVKEIGIDVTSNLEKNIIDASKENNLNVSSLNSFSNVAQTREQVYSLIDTMGQDSVVGACLETYTEDVTQPNDRGNIIWCESPDSNVSEYVTFLLDSLNVNKNAYSWAYNLIKYGDLYLKLYKESDYGEDLLFNSKNAEAEKLNQSSNLLNEDVKLKVTDKGDHYVHYVEMMKNPCEMFELTKFGKTMGYIKAPTKAIRTYNNNSVLNPYLVSYKMKKSDVTVYSATDFVHGCLENSNNRNPEEVNIYLNNEKEIENDKATSYLVKRGQSILQNTFKIWREMTLLENSVLLNRLTKSSIVRILNVEVGNMGKEQVAVTLQKLKDKIEQKTALNTGTGMTEYTNPGPVENMIYVPTREGKGNVTATTLGDGEVNPQKLTDLEYFRDKFFASLRVPKQFFCLRGDTEILLLNGEKHTIKELFDNKDKFIGKGIMGCNTDGSLCPTKISQIILTQPEATFLRIHLDNGRYVDVTDNHRMMLRDGTFVEAGLLKEGDSLMPYYDKITKHRRNVLDNKEGKYKLQYRVVAENKFGSADYVPECNHKVVKIEKLSVVEPAYDITVADDCHTFALPCGIFVHNCQTDDSTGFNGGTSLTIISSRYGKAIKRIQNTVCQTVTDLINIMLLDKGLNNYVNRFTIRMQEPVTQEEIDKREASANKVRYIGEIMSNLSDMPDDSAKLKVEKLLLTQSIADQEIIDIIDEQIKKLEAQEQGKAEKSEGGENLPPLEDEGNEGEGGTEGGGQFDDFNNDVFGNEGEEVEPTEEPAGGETLPSAADMGLDFTQNK